MRLVSLGILIGIGVGWILFDDGAISARRDARTKATAIADSHSKPAAETHASAPAPPPDALDPNTPAYVYPRDVNGKKEYAIDGTAIKRRPLAEIDAAMAKARAEKNWPAFLRGILQLCLLDSPEADTRLVELLADETLAMRGVTVGDHFYGALHDSQVDGIAQAVRVRARIELQQKKNIPRAGLGFLGLLARHGNAEDFAWIESLTTDNNGLVRADRAFALAAANPAAAERMRRRYIEHGIPPANEWHYFVRENPTIAFETAAQLIRQDPTDQTAYRMLGAATRTESLPDLRAALAQLPDDRARLLAMRAVQALHTRRMDTTGFDRVLDAPRVVLERALSGQVSAAHAKYAMSTIRWCSVGQTPSNIAALQATVDRGRPKAAEAARTALKQIRQQNTQFDWEPDRR